MQNLHSFFISSSKNKMAISSSLRKRLSIKVRNQHTDVQALPRSGTSLTMWCVSPIKGVGIASGMSCWTSSMSTKDLIDVFEAETLKLCLAGGTTKAKQGSCNRDRKRKYAHMIWDAKFREKVGVNCWCFLMILRRQLICTMTERVAASWLRCEFEEKWAVLCAMLACT